MLSLRGVFVSFCLFVFFHVIPEGDIYFQFVVSFQKSQMSRLDGVTVTKISNNID